MKQIEFNNKEANVIAIFAKMYAFGHDIPKEQQEIINKFYYFIIHTKGNFTIKSNDN